jgi:hypothetical protein
MATYHITHVTFLDLRASIASVSGLYEPPLPLRIDRRNLSLA